MLSSEVVSVDKDTDEGNAVESLRFEDEDSCCLLELLPFDKLFTLESGKFMKYVINYKVLDNDRIHFTTSSIQKRITCRHILVC